MFARFPSRKRLLSTLIVCGVWMLLLTVVACTKDESPHPAALSATPDREQQSLYTFGIIYPLTHSYYETITTTASEAADTLGIELIVKAPDEANLEQQVRMLETMVLQGVDGIAIAPIDSEVLTPIIDRVVASGIPVVTFESDAPASNRQSFIGTDNHAAGYRMGEEIDRMLKGRGMILVESGMSEMDSLEQRLTGFLSYIEEYTDIDVLNISYNEGSAERALSELEVMIDAHPHFDAYVSMDFLSGETSILVWKAMGLSRYALTFGKMSEIDEALRNGQITSAVSLNENSWGKHIISSLYKAQLGEELPMSIDTGFEILHGEE